jgi:hypothetical protein
MSVRVTLGTPFRILAELADAPFSKSGGHVPCGFDSLISDQQRSVVELADTLVLETSGETREGSTPFRPTISVAQ